MKPNKQTKFKSITELKGNYINETKFYCFAVVFSPENENDHFDGCPPYIGIMPPNDYEYDHCIYFVIPYIIAYYSRVHAGFTIKGRKEIKDSGRKELALDIKRLLDINNE